MCRYYKHMPPCVEIVLWRYSSQSKIFMKHPNASFFIFIYYNSKIQATLRNVPRTRSTPLIYVIWRGEMANPPIFFTATTKYIEKISIVLPHDQNSHWTLGPIPIFLITIFTQWRSSETPYFQKFSVIYNGYYVFSIS